MHTHAKQTNNNIRRYTTSIIGNKTIDFIQRAAKQSRPFFVSAATRAPHEPQTPAPWYTNAFPTLTNLLTPAFNATGVGHVPWLQVRERATHSPLGASLPAPE
jgi:N-acetylglucosamine-6-sulfatase